MIVNSILFIFFSSISIISAIFVICSKNPIFSVLFLIFTFANVTCILFIFNLEFLPISFVIIYVGAIAVLFLFVLMMLNIKFAELTENTTNNLPFIFIFSLLFLSEICYLFKFEFFDLQLTQISSELFIFDYLYLFSVKYAFLNFCQLFSNVQTVSFALFNDYLYCFFLSSLVLLLAMIGTISLTLKKQWKSRTQNFYSQLMKNTKKSIISYK